MKKQIAVGVQDFEKIRERDALYIDKTDFIREWWDEKDDVTLITRPRRFGKTLNMSMLNCFFSNRYHGRNDLFEGLDIWEEERFRKLQGTYPVLFFSGQSPSSREPENFYHGLVLGLLVENAPEYMVKSNRESGYGRYDVVLEPKDIQKPAVVLEFKVFDQEDDEIILEDTAANTLKQIEDKRYETDLLARGIPQNSILKYGMAFQGKTCLIRKG